VCRFDSHGLNVPCLVEKGDFTRGSFRWQVLSNELFLLILIGSTLGAMILWAMHIERQRSERDWKKEADAVASACR